MFSVKSFRKSYFFVVSLVSYTRIIVFGSECAVQKRLSCLLQKVDVVETYSVLLVRLQLNAVSQVAKQLFPHGVNGEYTGIHVALYGVVVSNHERLRVVIHAVKRRVHVQPLWCLFLVELFHLGQNPFVERLFVAGCARKCNHG